MTLRGPEETPPLEGVLVADLSRVLAGPLATMMLADLGASVIKVEKPNQGDDTRAWGPPFTKNSSAYFEAANRSKKSIALDFREPDDLEIAHELCRRADVVVENFRPGSLQKYGLDYESVSDSNRGVVYCSISGFGSKAGADRPGYDFVAQAVGGLMSITGSLGGEPQKTGVALVDVLTSKDALIGILAALRARERSQIGQHVQVNLMSSLLGSLANQASAFLATGKVPLRQGNEHPSIAPYEMLRCRNGLIAVACGTDTQFQRFCEQIGISDLATDQRFQTNAQRVANRGELVLILENALAMRDMEDLEAGLTAAGVPAGKVRDIGEAIDLAIELGLEPIANLDGTATPQIRHPISYSRTTIVPPSGPPFLNADGDPIRAWLSATNRFNKSSHKYESKEKLPLLYDGKE